MRVGSFRLDVYFWEFRTMPLSRRIAGVTPGRTQVELPGTGLPQFTQPPCSPIGPGMPGTRNAVWRMIRHRPVVAVDRVHLRDAVRLLREINRDPDIPIEVASDERGLSLTWGNAVARLPATDWLVGRFEVTPRVFFDCMTFPARVRRRLISVRYCGRDQIVFGRYRVPGIRFVD